MIRRTKTHISLLFIVLMLTACNTDGKYEVKNGKVYFTYWTFSFGTLEHELPEVDAASFKSVEDWLGRDDHHVWYKNLLVESADPATVKAEEYPLFHDGHDYYYEGKAVGVADMKSFRVVKCDSYELWATDNHYVYFKTQRIEDSDPATLEVIDLFEAKDKRHVYYFGHILEGADPATYEAIPKSNYSKDRNHVWYCGDLVEGADPASFEILSSDELDAPDARDKNRNYNNGSPFSR